MPTDDKVRENRARRAAERQGLRLAKCRRRDPLSLGFGTFGLRDAETDTLVAGSTSTGYGLTLAQVEAELRRGR